MNKVMIISLDGFTWNIGPESFISDIMPKIGELREQGLFGNLRSVLPYETCPAWASFQSGCLPQKTGIYSFIKAYQDNKLGINSASDLRVPVLQDVLNGRNKFAIYINLPVTYPMPINNGIVIPGLPCSELNTENVYPPNIYREYIANSGYEIVNTSSHLNIEDFVNTQMDVERRRLHIAKQLMKDYNWDLFCYHIQSTDHLQHKLWPALDVRHPQHNSEEYKKVAKFYNCCDYVINELTSRVPSNTLILIISDHGFETVSYLFYLNSWLRKNKYLKIKSQVALIRTIKKYKNNIVAILKKTVPGVKCCSKYLGPKLAAIKFGSKNVRTTLSGIEFLNIVDFKKTEIYSLACLGGVGYILKNNVDLDSLFGRLMKEFGPDSTIPIIKAIHPCLNGNRTLLTNDPAFVIEYNKGVFGILDPSENNIVRKTHYSNSVDSINGTHSPEGILVMHGPGVRRGVRLDARIVDIMPTVLAYMGLPVPRHVDGRVLQDAFETPLTVSYEDIVKGQPSEAMQYTASEQAAIEKKLGDLGYL